MSNWTKDRFVEELKRVAASEATPTKEAFLKHTRVSEHVFSSLFPGQWKEVLKLAKLEPNPIGTPPWADGELLAKLDDVVTKLSRIPTQAEFTAESGVPWRTLSREPRGFGGTKKGIITHFRDWLQKTKPESPSLDIAQKWLESPGGDSDSETLQEDEPEAAPSIPAAEAAPAARPFGIEDAQKGLFLERAELEAMLVTWRRRKNLILQGPPGVGKSHLARRLAYALLGAEDPARVKGVQFHQSYAYEDFVQGWRPSQAGGFERMDGSFMRFCLAAQRVPGPCVFVIDEINRGNLSKIFGELMVLLEADKRGPDHAMPLMYSRKGDPDFYVPENIYMMGLMNTADRSLALVDYALRRRFSFVALRPQFESPNFRQHLSDCGVKNELIGKIIDRLAALNHTIENDVNNLGPGFCVGHSYFCPAPGSTADERWYREVVATEIAPLLREYWFDDPEKAMAEIERLLA